MPVFDQMRHELQRWAPILHAHLVEIARHSAIY
jgi:hypothetical protein